jgi:hypothetical protein
MISKIFNDKQMNRYAKFKESSLENRKKARSTQKIECPRIKKVVQSVLGENMQISNTIQIAMHGIAKIFAGEIIEEAKCIMVDEEENLREHSNNSKVGGKFGPVRTRHLREARRKIMARGRIFIID